MDEPIARYYDPDKNPDQLFLPGVPLADMPKADWDRLPEWLQHSADALGWYSAARPAVRKAAAVKATDDRDGQRR